MFKYTIEGFRSRVSGEPGRSLRRFTLTLLLIEFLDEFVFGALGLQWIVGERGRPRRARAGGSFGRRLARSLRLALHLRAGARRRRTAFSFHPTFGERRASALERAGRALPVPALSARAGCGDEAGAARNAGFRKRRMVFDTQSAAICAYARTERDGDDGGESVRHRQQPDSTRFRTGRRSVWPRGDDVAAPRRPARVARRVAANRESNLITCPVRVNVRIVIG